MAVLAQFDTLEFEISSSSAMLLQGLKMSSECETEDETSNSQAYVKAKNGKPVEINFTAIFNAALGVDVESNITYLMNAAQRSVQSYFYVAGKKIFPFKLMMVKAETEEILLSPSGKMVKTNVNVTLKQCSRDWISGDTPADSGGGSSGGGSTKKSIKKTDVYMPPEAGYIEAPKKETTSAAVQNTSTLVNAAKKAVSAITQSDTTTKKLTTMEKRLQRL